MNCLEGPAQSAAVQSSAVVGAVQDYEAACMTQTCVRDEV